MDKLKMKFWQKMGWAIFWAIFFTNSSGHPGVAFEDAPGFHSLCCQG
jgi:hypothetical protein